MQNFRVKKTAVFLAPIILFSGLNFCFVNIQTAFGEISDSPSFVAADALSATQSCTDNHTLASAASLPTITINEKSDPINNTGNPLPSCCLNHDNAAKIEAVQNRETDNSSQPLATENYSLNYKLALANALSAYTRGLSPPPEDSLSSIVKKE